MKSQKLRQFIRKTINEYAGHFNSKNAIPRPENDKAEMKQYTDKNYYPGGLGNHYNKDTVGDTGTNTALQEDEKDTRNTAGILIKYKNEYLLCQRESGKWSIPKGHLKEGEEALEGAVRELEEETKIPLYPKAELFTLKNKITNKEGGDYSIFLIKVSDKLEPELNHEHKDYGYFTQDTLPKPLDKGLSFLKIS
jgi:ADP-ribose pyrophosphatase YjhB (NUDIX family)